MRFSKVESSVPENDMTPMIDVVFQLIAFFMIVTNFEQTQADERVKLPADQLAKPPKVANEKELVLNVGFVRDLDGNKLDDQPFVFRGDETVRVLSFGPYFEQEKRVATAKYGENGVADTVVEIRADSEVPTGLVQELIRLAQESGFEKFALKAMTEEE